MPIRPVPEMRTRDRRRDASSGPSAEGRVAVCVGCSNWPRPMLRVWSALAPNSIRRLADPLHAGSPAVGVSGVGLSLQDAFQGCIGEGIEYLSQLQTRTMCWKRGPNRPAAAQGPPTREFLAAFSTPTVCVPMRNSHGIASDGSPIVARSCCRRTCACAGRRTARDQAAVSVEYRIGGRHVVGRCGAARAARIDRTRCGQPVVAGRQPRPIDSAPDEAHTTAADAAGAAAARRFGAAQLAARYHDGYRRALRCGGLLRGGRFWLCLRPVRRGRRSRPRPAAPFWKCARANWPMRWLKQSAGSAAKPRSMSAIEFIGGAPR